MGLETASFISELDPANPTGSDVKGLGDNHLRLIKYSLKNQFPNFTAAQVLASVAEMNYLVGVTSGIQTQLNGKVSALNAALTGVPTAPTAPFGTATTQIATTQFVANVSLSTALPFTPADYGKFPFLNLSGNFVYVALDPMPSLVRDARTSNVMLVAGDKGKWVVTTNGTYTQTADTPANLGAGWSTELDNQGSGVVTFAGLNIYQGQRYRLQGDGTTIRTTALADQGVMVVRDEKPQGTGGGTLFSSWSTRGLNTVQTNTISGASLASNQITLPAGVYVIDAKVPSNNVEQHKSRLYNVTGSAVLIVGSSGKSFGNSIHPTTHSFISGGIALSGAMTIRIEDICAGAGSYNGGTPANIASTVEVYSEITIRKVG